MKRFVPAREMLRSPLARRLIVTIVLASSAITLCLTALQLYGEYRSELGGIEDDFRQIEEVHLKSLSQSLWTTDLPELQLHIDGIVNMSNLEYIVVREGGRIWAQAGHRASRNIIERQFPMTYVHRGQTLEIGALTVVATLDVVYRDLIKRAITILASNALKTFLVAGFAFVFFHWLVTRHLVSLAAYLRDLDLRGRVSPLILERAAGRRHDELDEVAAQLNRMLDAQIAAYRQLREDEEALRQRALIFENATDAIMILDLKRHILDWNPASERLFGYRKHEVLGRNTEFLYPPEDYAKYTPVITEIITRGERWVMERVLLRKDGTKLTCETIRAPLLDAGGTLIGRIGLTRDITERKRAEEARARLAAIVENSNDAIIGRGRDRTIISWNAAAERILGYTAAEAIGRDLTGNYPPDLREMAMEIRRLVATGVSVPYFETVRVTKDGRRIDVGLSVSPIRDSNGDIIGTAATLRDITERKQAEEALREREHLMRLITENVPAMIAYFDAELICRFANTAFCEFHRLDPQGVIGKTIQEIAGENTYRLIRPSIDLVKAGKPAMLHREERTAAGGIRHIEIHRVPDMSPEGAFRGYFAMLLDITEHRQAERTLQTAHAKLRELSRRLREAEESERNAISRELHDRIGQGLSTLSLMVGTLPARLPKEARSAARMQLKDMQALLRSVVANVRDVMAELRPPALDDYGLLAALQHLVTEFSRRTGIAVELNGVELHPRLPLVVETAMFRISQEALSNIVKHAHAKKVEISLNAVSDRVVLDIADDGSGFDTSNAPDGEEHWGMITMRERAEAAGVAFRLESAPGAGTRVVLEAGRAAT